METSLHHRDEVPAEKEQQKGSDEVFFMETENATSLAAVRDEEKALNGQDTAGPVGIGQDVSSIAAMTDGNDEPDSGKVLPPSAAVSNPFPVPVEPPITSTATSMNLNGISPLQQPPTSPRHSPQQTQSQHHPAHHQGSINTLPEKIANHPWILCLTKNEYLSPSPSSGDSRGMGQQEDQVQPQGIFFYPPASTTHTAGQGPPSFYPSFPQADPQHPLLPPLSQHQQQHHRPSQQQQAPQQMQYQIVSTTPSGSRGSSSLQPYNPGNNTATDGSGPLSKESNFLDITEYLNMPQTQAAKHIGIPTSTLSKRWREAARQRKWPWRTVCKIDKEIMTLLHNVPTSSLSDENSIPEDVKQGISLLLRRRQAELQSVVIRIN